MVYEAYWMKPDKTILAVTDRHIVEIVVSPEKFGLTKAAVDKAYRKFHEKPGSEGNAREYLMSSLIAAGWIRARFVRQQDIWTFQVQDRESFAGIKTLCKYIIAEGASDFSQCVIIDLSGNRLDNDRDTISEVAAGSLSARKKASQFAEFLNPAKVKTKLLASSVTEAGITRLISEYFFGSTIRLETNGDVYNLKGKINGYRVIRKAGRFRFEEIQ